MTCPLFVARGLPGFRTARSEGGASAAAAARGHMPHQELRASPGWRRSALRLVITLDDATAPRLFGLIVGGGRDGIALSRAERSDRSIGCIGWPTTIPRETRATAPNWPREPLQQPTSGFVHNAPRCPQPHRHNHGIGQPMRYGDRQLHASATARPGFVPDSARHHVVAPGPIQSGNCRWVVAAVAKSYYTRQNRARCISPVPLWRDHGPNDRWNTMAADPS